LKPDEELFKGVSAEQVHSMAMRLGSRRFTLHDLRKMLYFDFTPLRSGSVNSPIGRPLNSQTAMLPRWRLL
jgi:hypothetical protein